MQFERKTDLIMQSRRDQFIRRVHFILIER